MTKFKVSLHCGQVNTFQVREADSQPAALNQIQDEITNAGRFLHFGDILVANDQITFVLVEELIERTEEPTAGATIEV